MKRFWQTQKHRQKGFTLVELLLATALFSFILLFATAGIIQVNRAYNKGLTVKRMHQSAREIITLISRSMLTSTSEFPLNPYHITYGAPPNSFSAHGLCMNNNLTLEWVDGYIDRAKDPHRSYGFLRRVDFCGRAGNPLSEFDASIPLPVLRNDLPIVGNPPVQTESILDVYVAVDEISINHMSGNTYEIIVSLASNHPDTDFDISTPDDKPCDDVTDPYCDFVTLRSVVTLRN